MKQASKSHHCWSKIQKNHTKKSEEPSRMLVGILSNVTCANHRFQRYQLRKCADLEVSGSSISAMPPNLHSHTHQPRGIVGYGPPPGILRGASPKIPKIMMKKNHSRHFSLYLFPTPGGRWRKIPLLDFLKNVEKSHRNPIFAGFLNRNLGDFFQND